MMTEQRTDYIVVTGVSSGIGYATAADLIEHGYHVFGSVRRPEDAARVQADLGSGFTPLHMDVTDAVAVQQAAEIVVAEAGDQGLFGLVNNAGIAVGGPLMHLPIDELRRQFEVNVFGAMTVTQAFLPLLGARRDAPSPPGRIVNLSSVSGHTVYPFVGPYAASKHALEALSHALRRELMLYGIDVILIVAGAVATPIWGKMDDGEVARYVDTDYVKSGSFARETAARLGSEGMPASRVAVAIREALTSPKPKTTYLLTNNWLMGWYLPRKYPTRRLDRLIARQLGLRPSDRIDDDDA